MVMKITLRQFCLFLAVGMAFFSCGRGGESAADQDGSLADRSVASARADSLREAYEIYYAALLDTLPENCRAERGKVYPADQAPADTAFFVFRESMRRAVAEKNIFDLLAGVDEDIKLGFGGEGGLKDFIALWELDSPEAVSSSPVWPVLADLLAQGGTFNDRHEWFEAPYVSSCWPEGYEPMDHGLIAGAGVRLRADPGLNTQVVTTLSHDVVVYIERTAVFDVIGGEEHPWIKVKTLDGKEGFVYGKFYATPIGQRLIFQPNEEGEWKMTAMLAGD